MAKRYAIIHQGPVTVGPRPGGTAPAPTPTPSDPGTPPVKPDPAVSVGTLDSSVEPSVLPITIAAYDPAAFNSVLEVHALQLPPGQAVPSDPLAALALSCPKGSADTSAINGATFNLPIPAMVETAAGTEDTLLVIIALDN